MEKVSRKEQILQSLVQMLELSTGELITTANLAKTVGVSEAALYRHFPSKYKMFESLIEYIEESVFSRVNRIMEEELSAQMRCEKICSLVLTFCEKNPGLARLLYGDVIVGEREQLRVRVVQFYEKIAAAFRQVFRDAELNESLRTLRSPSNSSALLIAVLEGKICRYARSGFRAMPTDNWKEQWTVLHCGIFAPRVSAF
jgi:TetR/AcrR family transcriptional regulator